MVYGHVARGVDKAGLPIDQGFFKAVDALIYAFHMPLFFFVSGYLFWGSVTARGFRSVLPSRLALLLWLYVIWSLGHGAIEVLLGRLTNGNLQWAEVFALWQPRAHFWYLYALALLVLVASAFAWVPERYRALALFVCSTALYTAPGLGTGWYPLLVVGWFLVYFAAGFLLASYRFKRQSFRSHANVAFLFWVALGIAWVAVVSQEPLPRLVFATVGIGLVSTVSALLAKYSRKVSRGLAFLGLPIAGPSACSLGFSSLLISAQSSPRFAKKIEVRHARALLQNPHCARKPPARASLSPARQSLLHFIGTSRGPS